MKSMTKPEQQSASILTDFGQIPINARYYRTVGRSGRTAPVCVTLLDSSLMEIGTFEVADPDILSSLREVVRDRDIDRRAKQDAVRFMPLKNGYSRVISPHYSPHL